MANDAKGLVAKLSSDHSLAQELQSSKNEQEFLEKAKKHGYDVNLSDFKAAVREFKASKEGMDVAAKSAGAGPVGAEYGLSIVGVDYAFVGVQTSSHK